FGIRNRTCHSLAEQIPSAQLPLQHHRYLAHSTNDTPQKASCLAGSSAWRSGGRRQSSAPSFLAEALRLAESDDDTCCVEADLQELSAYSPMDALLPPLLPRFPLPHGREAPILLGPFSPPRPFLQPKTPPGPHPHSQYERAARCRVICTELFFYCCVCFD
ncbi:Hypothetical protein, putative, partial [Bodo saltans]